MLTVTTSITAVLVYLPWSAAWIMFLATLVWISQSTGSRPSKTVNHSSPFLLLPPLPARQLSTRETPPSFPWPETLQGLVLVFSDPIVNRSTPAALIACRSCCGHSCKALQPLPLGSGPPLKVPDSYPYIQISSMTTYLNRGSLGLLHAPNVCFAPPEV